MNIINNNLLNNDNRYMKVTLKSKLIGSASLLILANYFKPTYGIEDAREF